MTNVLIHLSPELRAPGTAFTLDRGKLVSSYDGDFDQARVREVFSSFFFAVKLFLVCVITYISPVL